MALRFGWAMTIGRVTDAGGAVSNSPPAFRRRDSCRRKAAMPISRPKPTKPPSPTNLRYDPNTRTAIGLARGRYCLLMGNDDSLNGPDALGELWAEMTAQNYPGVVIQDSCDDRTGECRKPHGDRWRGWPSEHQREHQRTGEERAGPHDYTAWKSAGEGQGGDGDVFRHEDLTGPMLPSTRSTRSQASAH